MRRGWETEAGASSSRALGAGRAEHTHLRAARLPRYEMLNKQEKSFF